MAFQLGDEEMHGMSEMNLIPLIDIMLVLMIIFLVTSTVLNPAVPLELPSTTTSVPETPPKVIQISIDKNAAVYWDSEQLTLQQLQDRFKSESNSEIQPAIHLRADKEARYDTVAKVLALATEAKLTKIAFVSE